MNKVKIVYKDIHVFHVADRKENNGIISFCIDTDKRSDIKYLCPLLIQENKFIP